MPQRILPFTAVQSGSARQIDFPLHPQTVSEEQVGALLQALLEAITGQIEAHARVSDGDVLQALCMALAIRMHMVDAPIGAVQQLVASLLDQADDAVAGSSARPAGKA